MDGYTAVMTSRISSRLNVIEIVMFPTILSIHQNCSLPAPMVRHLAKGLFIPDLASAEFSAKLSIPVLGYFLGLERLSSFVLVRLFLPAK